MSGELGMGAGGGAGVGAGVVALTFAPELLAEGAYGTGAAGMDACESLEAAREACATTLCRSLRVTGAGVLSAGALCAVEVDWLGVGAAAGATAGAGGAADEAKVAEVSFVAT